MLTRMMAFTKGRKKSGAPCTASPAMTGWHAESMAPPILSLQWGPMCCLSYKNNLPCLFFYVYVSLYILFVYPLITQSMLTCLYFFTTNHFFLAILCYFLVFSHETPSFWLVQDCFRPNLLTNQNPFTLISGCLHSIKASKQHSSLQRQAANYRKQSYDETLKKLIQPE